MRKRRPRPQQITVRIHGLDKDGQGCTQVDGLQVHIRGALPGDRVRAALTHFSRQQARAYGHVIERIEDSPQRRPSPCPHRPNCDGCALIELNAYAQRAHKLLLLRAQLDAVLDAEHEILLRAIAPDLGYRRRVKLVARWRKGQLLLGAYRRRSHNFTETPTCPIATRAIRNAVTQLIPVLQEHDRQIEPLGALRFVQLDSNHRDQIFLTLVLSHDIEHGASLGQTCADAVNALVGVQLDLNPGPGDAVLAGSGRSLWGLDCIYQRIANLDVALSPYAFTQIHVAAGDTLGRLVSAAAQATSTHRVFDVYGGSGALSLALAKEGLRCVVVEREPSALRSGAHVATRHELPVDFVIGDGATFLDGLAPKLKAGDLIIVDPPRRGLDERARLALAHSPANLLYVSCKPSSLTRDLRVLLSHGYRIQAFEALDLFAHTTEVECVVLLGKTDAATRALDLWSLAGLDA